MPDLVGTWRLVGVISHDPDGEPLTPPYGSHPIGRIVFNTQGRVVVAVCDGRRELPAGAKREYGGYTGAFTFDGSTLTTQVDASPNPALVGTAQVRGVRIDDDDRIVLIPPPREIDNVIHHRELTWERMSPE